MNESINLQKHYGATYKAITILEISIAVISALMPWLLFKADGTGEWKSSISAYVYMEQNAHVYGILLCMAAMMFIFNGVLYFQGRTFLDDYWKKGRWYNIILGLALMSVAIFPCEEYALIHNSSAVIFFLGSGFFIAFFHAPQHKWISRVIGFLSVACLISWKFFSIPVSLLVAEWISLVVIAIHYVLEALGIISLNRIAQDQAKIEERL